MMNEFKKILDRVGIELKPTRSTYRSTDGCEVCTSPNYYMDKCHKCGRKLEEVIMVKAYKKDRINLDICLEDPYGIIMLLLAIEHESGSTFYFKNGKFKVWGELSDNMEPLLESLDRMIFETVINTMPHTMENMTKIITLQKLMSIGVK